MAEAFDLVVVGGGFAGLSLAREAARGGLGVLVLERRAELGVPVRTSGATWMAAARALGVPESCRHPVRVARIFSAGETTELAYAEPPGCILDVTGLLRHLGREARAQGAEIRTGSEVEAVTVEAGRAVGVRAGEDLRARLVADASGIGSLLARSLGAGGCQRYGLGVEVLCEAPDWDPETVGLWLGPPWAGSGYAWAFPEGGSRVRLGVGLLRPDSPESPRRNLEALLASGRPEVAALAAARRLEIRTGAIPSEPIRLPLLGPGWLLAGDAGGAASPLLGEGIRFALEMGEGAGRAVARALKETRPAATEAVLARWAREWEARYGAKFRLEHRLNRRLSRLDGAGWDRAVRLVRRLPGELPLELLKGDFSPRFLFGTLLRSPGAGLRLGYEALRAAWGGAGQGPDATPPGPAGPGGASGSGASGLRTSGRPPSPEP